MNSTSAVVPTLRDLLAQTRAILDEARRHNFGSSEAAAINAIVADIKAKLEVQMQAQNALFAVAFKAHEAEKIARGEMRKSDPGIDAAFFAVSRALRRLSDDLQARHRHEAQGAVFR